MLFGRIAILGACLLIVSGCASEGSGTGGQSGTSGAGGGAGIGGAAGVGGGAGSAGTGGAGGDAGTGGAAPSLGIECDPIVRLDDYDMGNGGPRWAQLVHSGDHAAAIWNERGSGYEGVTVARYDFVADAWSAPFDVFSETSPGFTPWADIAIDADGDVTSLVREVYGGDQQLWTRTYDAATQTWGSPEEADSDTYSTYHGFVDDSYANDRDLYTVAIDIDADTFGAPVPIHEAMSPLSIGSWHVARSESGLVIAAWGQTRTIGGQTYPWASAYDGAWSTPLELDSSILSGTWNAVVDASGTATVAWASGFPGVFATRNTGPGGSFIEAQEITGQVQGGSGNLGLVAHDSGDFLAVWEDNSMIRAARCRSAPPPP